MLQGNNSDYWSWFIKINCRWCQVSSRMPLQKKMAQRNDVMKERQSAGQLTESTDGEHTGQLKKVLNTNITALCSWKLVVWITRFLYVVVTVYSLLICWSCSHCTYSHLPFINTPTFPPPPSIPILQHFHSVFLMHKLKICIKTVDDENPTNITVMTCKLSGNVLKMKSKVQI